MNLRYPLSLYPENPPSSLTPPIPRIFFLRFQPIFFIPLFLTKIPVLGKYKGDRMKNQILSWQAFQQRAGEKEFIA
jgi:hypothetical protein